MIGMQLAYYGAAAIKVRDYTRKDTGGRSTYTPIPDWGWILETVAGVLWLIIAAISACELSVQRPTFMSPGKQDMCRFRTRGRTPDSAAPDLSML